MEMKYSVDRERHEKRLESQKPALFTGWVQYDNDLKCPRCGGDVAVQTYGGYAGIYAHLRAYCIGRPGDREAFLLTRNSIPVWERKEITYDLFEVGCGEYGDEGDACYYGTQKEEVPKILESLGSKNPPLRWKNFWWGKTAASAAATS